ncbi:MAG: nucleotide sugar dehydrogenase [Bacteroidales bacterium]|nr:nucleotide sugar dehydrogenase [Bacteroidales bacterium]MBP5682408.1 nucleotide sugar dehydrogenase [Bacteroidales bacterium]
MTKITIIGLGYVGLPLAVLFASKHKVTGFDTNSKRVGELKHGIDRTGETAPKTLQNALDNDLIITDNENLIKDSDVFIVTVPTPVDANNRPDLAPLIAASRTVGNVIRKGNVVIFESTVYPGVTEEVCVPEIEKASGLKFNIDFYAGYSPERINPGDTIHTVENIVKVTSGSTPEIAKFVDSLYSSVLKNGTFPVSSIRIAEASKIIENSQRDVNIAFMNELAKIFNAMGIDTNEVIDAAATKWNFIKMRPGLVGGHCIGVDPYYLIQKAQVYGIMPRVMMAARRLNDGMGEYVANQVIKLMNLRGIMVKDAEILLLGFTFKENCRDIRNTKVADIYSTLHQYTPNITVLDPWADAQEVNEKYGIKITKNATQNTGYNAIVLCVAHDDFRNLNLREMLKPSGGIVYDVKGFMPQDAVDGRL